MMQKALSPRVSGAKLRTKTGCFTCRRRKVKCGEEWPYCKNCSIAGRRCNWPLVEDLCDRRHCPQAMRRAGNRPDDEYDDDDSHVPGVQDIHAPTALMPLRITPRTSPLGSDMELDLVHHYLDNLVSYHILPNVHNGFYLDWGACVVRMMLSQDCVRFSVLTCAACNKYMLTNDDRYRKWYIRYYARAIKEVGNSVIRLSKTKQGPMDQLLIAIAYLYIFALWSPDAYADAPNHVAGAMQLLQIMYQDPSAPLSMKVPTMRIATESVIYQAFLLYMRDPFDPRFRIDPAFIAQTESALETKTFADTSLAANSPVLGIPLSLYRLIIDIIKFTNSPGDFDDDALDRLRSEMRSWEANVVAHDLTFTGSSLQDSPHDDALALYTLAGSLLLDLVVGVCERRPCHGEIRGRFEAISRNDLLEQCAGAPRWQVCLGLSILRLPHMNEKWTRCFLGSWPLLIFGYAVQDEDDITLVKQVLHDIRHRIGYGEIQRILDELSGVWDMKKTGLVKARASLENQSSPIPSDIV